VYVKEAESLVGSLLAYGFKGPQFQSWHRQKYLECDGGLKVAPDTPSK
jgi:hypothetical protein